MWNVKFMPGVKTQGDFWGHFRGKMCLTRKEIPYLFIYLFIYTLFISSFICTFTYLLQLFTYWSYLSYLFIYLFDSFNFAASNSNYIASNDLIISEQWIGKDVGLVITELQYTILVLVWRVRGRTWITLVRIPALRVEIWHSLQNTIL
jgi:hypothetical protein